MVDLSKVVGFDWDEGNARKNEQHSVSAAEAEQVFFNFPLLVLSDVKHSEAEPRFLDAVDRLRAKWPEPVYRLLLTGPWPPYRFGGLRPGDEDHG